VKQDASERTRVSLRITIRRPKSATTQQSRAITNQGAQQPEAGPAQTGTCPNIRSYRQGGCAFAYTRGPHMAPRPTGHLPAQPLHRRSACQNPAQYRGDPGTVQLPRRKVGCRISPRELPPFTTHGRTSLIPTAVQPCPGEGSLPSTLAGPRVAGQICPWAASADHRGS
jgi:hypothetical protein